MLSYLIRRVLIMIPTLLAISAIVFIIIQLPPGDYLTTLVAELQSQGEAASLEKINFLRQQYGLDRSPGEQYLFWIAGLLQGDLGYSFEFNLPVAQVIGDRLLRPAQVGVSSGGPAMPAGPSEAAAG